MRHQLAHPNKLKNKTNYLNDLPLALLVIEPALLATEPALLATEPALLLVIGVEALWVSTIVSLFVAASVHSFFARTASRSGRS